MELLNGTNLQGGKYKILEKIGQGGFGITYKAEDTLLERKVAIKEFFFNANCERQVGNNHVTYSSGNREFVDKLKLKFLKEAKRLAKFNHDNIVRIYDVFEENSTAYFVMEYIQSGSLDDLVRKSGKLTESKALAYIQELGEAIHFLHTKKTCHLDIKPANILLAENGGIKLIDFGLSKQYDDSSIHTTTLLAVSKGYAPIEQYSQGGISDFSPTADIYSLGATLYFLLKGDAPPDAIQLVVNGMHNIEKVSERTNAAIQHAMKANCNERPQNVLEWLARFEKTNAERTQSTKGKIHVKKPDDTIVAQPTDDTEILQSIRYGDTVTDIDGNVYKTVKIGNQVWMAENLKTTRFNDGSIIPLITKNSKWENLSNSGFCWYDNNETTHKNKYGALYNWFTVNTGKLCPKGWHVPSDDEWNIVINFLGGGVIAGGKLKEMGISHWQSPNTGASNETGFTAIPSGYRHYGGTFYFVGDCGHWWSSSESISYHAWYRYMHYYNSDVDRNYDNKQFGFSVRCLRDY